MNDFLFLNSRQSEVRSPWHNNSNKRMAVNPLQPCNSHMYKKCAPILWRLQNRILNIDYNGVDSLCLLCFFALLHVCRGWLVARRTNQKPCYKILMGQMATVYIRLFVLSVFKTFQNLYKSCLLKLGEACMVLVGHYKQLIRPNARDPPRTRLNTTTSQFSLPSTGDPCIIHKIKMDPSSPNANSIMWTHTSLEIKFKSNRSYFK